jgi:hypothetical protein
MKIKDLIAHLQTQDPEEEAEILFVESDTGTVSAEPIQVLSEGTATGRLAFLQQEENATEGSLFLHLCW